MDSCSNSIYTRTSLLAKSHTPRELSDNRLIYINNGRLYVMNSPLLELREIYSSPGCTFSLCSFPFITLFCFLYALQCYPNPNSLKSFCKKKAAQIDHKRAFHCFVTKTARRCQFVKMLFLTREKEKNRL